MKKRQGRKRTRVHSLIAFLILTAYCVSCLLYFIAAVDVQIDRRMEERVDEVVRMQSDAIRGTLAVQFATLQSAAHFIAQTTVSQGDIFCDTNLQLLDSFQKYSYFSRTMLVDRNGRGYLNGGSRADSSEDEYFRAVMKGVCVLTQPIASPINGTQCVMLAVPVWKDGEAVGMFGGSYELSQVSDLLFSEVYDGHAVSYIVDSYGKLICASGNAADGMETVFEALALSEGDGVTVESLAYDFLHGQSGSFQCTHSGDERHTVAYSPLGVSGWTLVYAVPQEYVNIQYDFIKQYEMLLFGAIILGCALFLLYTVALMYSDRTRLSYQAKTDALSGLLNRAAAEEAIENLLRISGRVQGVMLLLDLDHFKDVNDSHGHQMGDKLIAQVGQTLLSTFRATDYCCRLGGDEFLIFMRGEFSHEIVCERAQRLCDTLPMLLKDELSDVHWSLSIGVAYAPADGKTFGELYRSADKALYAAKNKGRSCYCFYEARDEA